MKKQYETKQLLEALIRYHQTSQRGNFLDALGIKANIFISFILVVGAIIIGLNIGYFLQQGIITATSGEPTDYAWLFLVSFIAMTLLCSSLFLRLYTLILFWRERPHIIHALHALFPDHTINKEKLSVEGIDLEKALQQLTA